MLLHGIDPPGKDVAWIRPMDCFWARKWSDVYSLASAVYLGDGNQCVRQNGFIWKNTLDFFNLRIYSSKFERNQQILLTYYFILIPHLLLIRPQEILTHKLLLLFIQIKPFYIWTYLFVYSLQLHLPHCDFYCKYINTITSSDTE